MPAELRVDGSYFGFDDDGEVHKLDEWPEQAKLTAEPFQAKACDLVALRDGVLWLVEAKDYTYEAAPVPKDLARTMGLKVFSSLAIPHAVARWGDGERQEFSRRALMVGEARVCLAVELPDGGRKLQGVQQPLAHLKSVLVPVMKKLNVHRPVISNRHLMNDVPWTIRRDPETRARHVDR